MTTTFFGNCTALKSIAIPDSVTSVSPYAFYGCSNLEGVTVGSGVSELTYEHFRSCRSLNTIDVSPDNPYYSSIDGAVFSKDKTELVVCPAGKTDEYTIPNGTKTVKRYSVACPNITSVIIPDSVETAEEYSFNDCSKLEGVTVGSGVTQIAPRAFSGCESLKAIEVNAKNTAYSALDGVLFNKDKTELVYYPEGKTEGEYVIPSSVATIGAYAISSCYSLESITIPASVTKITYYNFGSTNINHVIYGGTEEQWQAIDTDNCSYFSYATVHYNGEGGYELSESVAASCQHEGYDLYKCTACDKTVRKNVTPITDHSFALSETVAPSCQYEGYDLYKCSVCGETKRENIKPVISHHYVLSESIAPSCTSMGYDSYECTMCYSQITANQRPATGHSYEVLEDVAPTCSSVGYKSYLCSVCHSYYQGDYVEATGHQKGELLEEIAPTCTGYGYSRYSCTFCKESYIDDWKEPLGHTEQFVEKIAATCTTEGYDKYTCTVCQDEIKKNVTVPLGHTKQFIERVAATCTEEGYDKYKCTVCQSEVLENRVEPLGHTKQFVSRIAATCTEGGHDEYTCTTCKAAFTENYTEPAGHIKSELVSKKAPTCGEGGYSTYKCSICNETFDSDYVSALSHDYTSAGKCKNCGNLVESKHNYDDNSNAEWVITLPNAESIDITFSSNTYTETNYDFIYIYDGAGNQIGMYDGSSLANKTITVTGNTVKIKLTSDGSETRYGFKITDIQAVYEKPALTGDLDFDGTVGANDYALLKEIAAGNAELTGDVLQNGDLNGDGAIDGFDAIMLSLIAAGN